MTSAQLDASVVILSYDRVHLLERTLRAALREDVADKVRHEIIVVDNHPERRAEALVAELSRASGQRLRYLHDARRNISIVRNLGIKAAQGRYVAFIDDDEAPESGWLNELVACLDRTGADAAFGPKLPEFEAGAPPAWDPEAWNFTCDFREAPDTELVMFGRLRRPGKGLGSGNAIFRVATCLQSEEPFSVAFGDANGEDTHLLFRLALEGRRFVWCPTAVVREYMERTRSTPDYILTRMKRGSQHYATCRIATSPTPFATRLKVTGLGLAQWAVHAALFIGSGEWRTTRTYRHRIGMAKGLGKLTWRAPIGFIEERAA